MSRWILFSLSAVGVALSPALAVAQPAPPPTLPGPPIDLGGGSIALEVQLADGDGGFAPQNEKDIREFFNRANCLCPSEQFAIEFTLENAPPSLDSQPVEVWFGTMCESPDPTIRDANCDEVHTFSDVEELRSPRTIPFSVDQLAGGTCEPNEVERNAYALIDEAGDGIGEGDYVGGPLGILVDTQPPPVPGDLGATGVEGGVSVNWDLPDSRTEDIEYFQLLCMRADGSSSEDDDFPRDIEQRYLTAADACGLEDPSVCPQTLGNARVIAGGVDGGPPDAGTIPDGGPIECAEDLPEALARLSRDTLCGEAGGTSTSISVGGLEVGVAYRVVLVVVDPARNALAIDMGEVTPGQALDFWEDYRAQGGTARGGCATGGESIGWLALAFGVVSVLIAFRRRRGGAAILALVVSAAGAQSASAEPWWENVDEPIQDGVGAGDIHWNLEFKFGPYVPAVDEEFDLGPGEVGPFERMYGDGPFLMSQTVLDYFLVHNQVGQLGVSASAGYLTRSVNAFQLDENGELVMNEDGDPRRAPGNNTTFRMIPMSLGLVYRMTQLDDRYRVPIVPYGRLGLSYYFWWVTRPGGSLAEVPTSNCPDIDDDDCDGDRARGGSLGWQGTVGLALRAERIDPDAEVALRTELGIEHAGFLVEMTYAKVDGFGSDKKLSLGDLTWFGGINFEF